MNWFPAPPPWGKKDALALFAWTAVIAAFFWDLVSLQAALFYFDVTEINLPYRDFFADELKAGRFSRWHPGLYCGMPLYSESQAGYLHPLKYLLYPWLETWQAFGLDTVLSVWLTGLGAFGWLRRHVGPAGALTGAAIFGLSGFLWAHLIHTSMVNAMVSVPLAVWGLECACDGGRLRGVALGALALACQIFAGHLQDFLLTSLLIGAYGAYRAGIERGARNRLFALGAAAAIPVLGAGLSAVQWIPSKELLDRSPRAEGLTWEGLTYGSWSPELLPTLVLREAYGTRARDTDWMDGFYPYHEMNTYMSVLGLGLAVLGLAGRRDRWGAFWPILATVGFLLMLGRFTILLDHAHEIPVLGSSRIPVRFHLWVSLAVAALAAIGTDRLARPGAVRLRWAVLTLAALVAASVPIMLVVYAPAFQVPDPWPKPYHQDRYRWLGEELIEAGLRTATLTAIGLALAATAARTSGRLRAAVAAGLPLVVIADLLGSHWHDVATIDPAYWTKPPASAEAIQADPEHQRVIGFARFSAGEPGYASTEIDFMAVRDTLAWSLPPVFGMRSVMGETPMIPTRWKRFMDATNGNPQQAAVAGASHILSGYPGRIADWPPAEMIGTAYVFTNPEPLPRVRLMGRPEYSSDEDEAVAALVRLGEEIRDRVVVEDPDRPLAPDAEASGVAELVEERPERLVIRTRSDGDAYLVVADTFDPGWSATVDGEPAAIRPAFVNFRAVFLEKGEHVVEFQYRPAGFRLGLAVSIVGALVALGMLLARRRVASPGPGHGLLGWPGWWPWGMLLVAGGIVAGSAVSVGPGGVGVHPRWSEGLHGFTWGAGLEAMQREPIAGPR
ncbi:hypothetical protein TsocGM_19025 [Tautonia sociabilis]|uniref:YfhO family protein n=1 Tax=Tautonia sociabilis TaxID=2080755 RepID=A0A432MG09_9BACT|nr:hypothetical protein TsocGM_19025 [Tautonia sociabilis]